MFSSTLDPSASKDVLYRDLARAVVSLCEGEPDPLANLANAAALASDALADINWCGFYLLRDRELVLGPFQGKPACVRIPLGKGVCGTAAERRQTLVVPDVLEFPGHIACDAASRSEIVVPIVSRGKLVGVFDVDAPRPARFDDDDREGLERFVNALVPMIAWESLIGAGGP